MFAQKQSLSSGLDIGSSAVKVGGAPALRPAPTRWSASGPSRCPATASSTARSSTPRPWPTRSTALFDGARHQDARRRRVALRQRGHRQEDHPAGDDRGRAVRVDPLGGRAVHPVRHPGRQPRLPDPLDAARRREGEHGRPARRGEEGQDRRLHRRHHAGGPDAGRGRRRRVRAAERLRGELRRRAGRGRRAAERRRERA